MGSLVNSTRHLGEKIIPILYRLLQKTESEGRLPNSEASITILLKPSKDTSRKVQIEISSKQSCKIFNISKMDAKTYTKNFTP